MVTSYQKYAERERRRERERERERERGREGGREGRERNCVNQIPKKIRIQRLTQHSSYLPASVCMTVAFSTSHSLVV